RIRLDFPRRFSGCPAGSAGADARRRRAGTHVRILFLTQVVPFPPDSGPKVKTYNTLRYLSQQHEVHLISFVRSATEAGHAERLRELCASVASVPLRRSRLRDLSYVAKSWFTGRPFLIERDDSSEMRRSVASCLGCHQFDAVHADQLSMAQFAIDIS